MRSDEPLESTMGPTIVSKVEVNGVSTDALIDNLLGFCHGCASGGEAKVQYC